MPKNRNRGHKSASAYSVGDESDSKSNKQGFSQKPHKKNIFTYIESPKRWWPVVLIAFLSLGVLGAGLKYLDESARAEQIRRQQNPLAKNDSLLASINPFSPAPTPMPTVQMSKEYIYAGSRTLAVEDAAASAVPPADLAVWRPSNGYWYCLGGAGGSQNFTVAWGMNGDLPAPGDYDDDGKTDLAVFRPSTGVWWIVNSGTGTYYTLSLGTANDMVAQADFDGDGKTDPAVFRPSTRVWYIYNSSTGSITSSQFGGAGAAPAAADYDGDGKADLAVWQDSQAKFYIYSSNLSAQQEQALGTSGSTPVPGDYDGDGKKDFAIRHGADWIIRQSSDGQINTITWYLETNIAVQNDYDGDGKCDVANWKPSGKGAGNWYIRNSHDGSTRVDVWGTSGDIPVPALYRR
jgi:FG-GAP-like repeat